MRPRIPFTLNPSAIYFKIKQELLPAHYAGTVASLPLFFEFTRRVSDFFKTYPYMETYTEVLKPADVKAIINASTQPLYGVHALAYNSFLYIPQIIPAQFWAMHSDIGDRSSLIRHTSQVDLKPNITTIPDIRIALSSNSHHRCLLTDIATFDFEANSPIHYNTPSIESFSFTTHLRTQIYTRYFANPGYIDSPETIIPNEVSYRSHSNNVVIDSYLPFSLCDYSALNSWFNESTLASNRAKFKAISPLTADLFGIKQVPLTDILYKVLDLSPEYLSDILNTVKRRKLIINFAGTGGTGINTIYWLNQLVSLFQIHELFREVHLFETDCVDLSNIFRFPLPLSTYTTTIMPASKKVNLIIPYVDDLCRYTYCHDSYLTSLSDFPSYQLNPDNSIKPNVITYGAPSVANRNFLSSVGNFISGTHANNTASLYINPVADETLQVETYGLIQLNSFFINQIRMAIGLIEILATNQETLQDTLFSDYTFLAQTKGSYIFNISEQMPAREIGDD